MFSLRPRRKFFNSSDILIEFPSENRITTNHGLKLHHCDEERAKTTK